MTSPHPEGGKRASIFEGRTVTFVGVFENRHRRWFPLAPKHLRVQATCLGLAPKAEPSLRTATMSWSLSSP